MKKTIAIFLMLVASCGMKMPAAEYRVHPGEKIAEAVAAAKAVYEATGETSIIEVEPGTYQEELTIDVPGLRLVNAAKKPSIEMKNGGVDIAEGAVRITWYYGHGYQYASMGQSFNYGGKRARRWNASVLVTAPGFYAENIIFENSFNLYVSAAEVADTMVDITRAEELCGQDLSAYWSEKERPKRTMPVRPKEVGSTEVQNRLYRERASALSFTSEATDCVLKNCRVVGRQDAFYGDHGASVEVIGGALCGAVDYIFGGLTLTVKKAELVAMVNAEKGDKCYISAARGANRSKVEEVRSTYDALPMKERSSFGFPIAALDSIPAEEYVEKGMLFEGCRVRFATAEEIVNPGSEPVYLGRPWRWWGETVFRHTKAEKGVLAEERWSLGLTKGYVAPFAIEK